MTLTYVSCFDFSYKDVIFRMFILHALLSGYIIRNRSRENTTTFATWMTTYKMIIPNKGTYPSVQAVHNFHELKYWQWFMDNWNVLKNFINTKWVMMHGMMIDESACYGWILNSIIVGAISQFHKSSHLNIMVTVL
jgi:hypothetical protein